MSAPGQDASEARLGTQHFTDLANVFLRFICHRDSDATDLEKKGSMRDQPVIQPDKHSSNVYSKDGRKRRRRVERCLGQARARSHPPGRLKSC